MLTLSDTFVAGLIGAGIGGSLSPTLHEREAAELGLPYARPASGASLELFTGVRPDRERMLRHFAELTA